MTAKIPSGGQRATASSHAKQEFVPMGCVSLSAAIAEVGKHLLGDDWIGDELSAPALNIRARRDHDIATAIKARQIALLEEQEGRLAVLVWQQQRAFSLDPKPLPELSKDNLADVEKALAKKWEGEEEARKRLESATAWLRRRLYGTPPDYGDAVPSYIPSWYGKPWRLPVGFWNSHSVQEVLFTEVKYHPGDYGEAFPPNADPLKGRVVILQEALREAITRDRAINQTDSGIDATASIEEGAAEGSSSHSADNQRDRDLDGIITDDHPSRREQQKRQKQEQHKRWYGMAQEIKAETKERLSQIKIARKIELKEKEAGNDKANAETIKRRLNEDYPGWAN